MNGGVEKRIFGAALGALALGVLALGALTLGALLAAGAAAAPAKNPPAKTAPAPAVGGPVFVDNTPLTEEQKIVHVLNRLGFGPRPGDVERVRAMGRDRYITLQLAPERIDDAALQAKLAPFTYLNAPSEQLVQTYIEGQRQARELRRLQTAAPGVPAPGAPAMENAPQMPLRRPMLPERNEIAAAVAQLQMAKVLRAAESERQLQEVLADFWTNHFNIDIRKNLCRVLKIADDRDVIRPHVLGKFRDLLGASAQSPAMLVYLDNAQSQVPQPVNPGVAAFLRRRGGAAAQLAPAPGQRTRGGVNENYAREIMELHTLGVDGGYTQKDVQEVARCLTGWGINRNTGRFQFSPRRHDNGEKIVLGQRIPAGGGIADGEAVLDILASHPATARFVSRKLCQRFVSDDPPGALVDRCVEVWKKTDGDLRAVVRTIVTSDEFFSRAAYRQKIKSPFEFAVSALRALDGRIDLSPGRARNLIGQGMVGQIAAMGEPLFQHQAPTGYPEDSRKWVSSGALIARLNFTLRLVDGRLPGVALDLASALPGGASASATPNGADPKALAVRIAERLLHGDVSPATRATLLRQVAELDGESTGAVARRVTALALGSPEFQRR